ncbi:peptide ABC transporter ATP-binding protein, partial [Candidatus Magnetomorum sp. HK-1]
MIFQNASEHLHPLLSIGKQYQLLLKKNCSNLKNVNFENVVLKIFNRVRLNHLIRHETITPFDIYQRPLSGGECQRAMIGMSLCAEKNLQLVLMDELTTDLDASNRDDIIKMIIDLKNKNENLSILFSSHDLD